MRSGSELGMAEFLKRFVTAEITVCTGLEGRTRLSVAIIQIPKLEMGPLAEFKT
jgi:hypothetical protein